MDHRQDKASVGRQSLHGKTHHLVVRMVMPTARQSPQQIYSCLVIIYEDRLLCVGLDIIHFCAVLLTPLVQRKISTVALLGIIQK